MRRSRRRIPNGRPAVLVQPDGTAIQELRADMAYVLMFNEPTSLQVCRGLMFDWSQMAQQGLVGPLVILPMGVDFAEIRATQAASAGEVQ